MLKFRLIFVKQFAFRRKVSHKQVFFRNEIGQKISRLSYSYETKRCSLSRSGSWGRHAETNALRDNPKDNCNKTTILQHLITNQKTHLWRILRYIQIIDKVSLKLHKALSKTFCLDTVNFFYSPSDENAYSPC